MPMFLVLGLGLDLEYSYPWPQEGLSSRSRSLTSGFLCPWPWPRAFCPPLLLCFKEQKLHFLDAAKEVTRLQHFLKIKHIFFFSLVKQICGFSFYYVVI